MTLWVHQKQPYIIGIMTTRRYEHDAACSEYLIAVYPKISPYDDG